MDLGLKDKRVIVTASTKGIGFAVAKEFLREGARVVISSRSKENVEKALEKLAEYKDRVYGLTVDLTREEDIEKLFKQAIEFLGGLDILVYNVGGPKPGRFIDLEMKDWEHGVRLLLLSAVKCTYEALKYMSKGGSIVFLASYAIREPIPEIVLSNSIRIGLAGLVRSLAGELGPKGIRVNMVLPGLTLTERIIEVARKKAGLEGKSVDEVIKDMTKDVPLGRPASPEEIAHPVVFLASEAASYIHGATLLVDGGIVKHVF